MVQKKFLFYKLLLSVLIELSFSKVYSRCELARELKYVHKVIDQHIPIWVCLAHYESQYNTSKLYIYRDGSRSNGILQINSKEWCFPYGRGCGVPCYMLLNDRIADDILCARNIYRKIRSITGDGFKAWSTYEKFCIFPKANSFIQGCF